MRGLSTALFAPGWTYEKPHETWENSGKTPEASSLFKKQFFEREYTFWALLEPFLNIHGPSLHFSKGLGTTPGFKTCFSFGLGSTTSSDSGISEKAWYNLRKTEYQPSLIVVNEATNQVCGDSGKPSIEEVLPYTSYTSSLCSMFLNQSLFISTIKIDEGPVTVPIFICELSLDPGDVAIFLVTISVRLLNL